METSLEKIAKRLLRPADSFLGKRRKERKETYPPVPARHFHRLKNQTKEGEDQQEQQLVAVEPPFF